MSLYHDNGYTRLYDLYQLVNEEELMDRAMGEELFEEFRERVLEIAVEYGFSVEDSGSRIETFKESGFSDTHNWVLELPFGGEGPDPMTMLTRPSRADEGE